MTGPRSPWSHVMGLGKEGQERENLLRNSWPTTLDVTTDTPPNEFRSVAGVPLRRLSREYRQQLVAHVGRGDRGDLGMIKRRCHFDDVGADQIQAV